MTGTNPLAAHFRQPAIYLKLPSQGRFWPEGTIDLPVTGEVPIYPMTTKDEIRIRTPDALLSGQGVVDVIESCCPSIKNAWQMPNVESDAVLIAVRVASYGNEMKVDSKCPHCSHESQHIVDLTGVLDRIKFPDYDRKVSAGGLEFKLRPQSYEVANKANLAGFEEQKMIENLLAYDEMELEEKKSRIDQHIKNINMLNLDMLVGFVSYVEMPDGSKVSDPAHIREYFDNADMKIVKQIENAIKEINSAADIPPVSVQCEECDTDYEVRIEFDYTRFFDNGS